MNGLKENECPDLLTLVKVRSSVRSFKSSKVERAKLEYILEVARLAPSAVNFQPWAFVVVRDPEKLKALYDCYPREWFASAPMCPIYGNLWFFCRWAILPRVWRRRERGNHLMMW